jgi:hypothetical protein
MCRGFSYNGKTLLSGIDPAGRADRVAEAAAVSDRTLYFCPSPLYGYGLEHLLARIAPDSALLCIEAEPELFALSQQHFGAALINNPQLRLTNLCNAGALCAFLRQEWGLRSFRRVEMVRLTGGWQLFPALYDTLADILRREIAISWGNAMTLTRLGRRYIRNAIQNIALIPRYPSLRQLSFGAEPVLVLGAGPSLDPLLDALWLRFGKALQSPDARPFRIVCVDTCLASLRERGITPDLAVILESQHWNLEDFIGLSGWDVPAAMDLSALPRSGDVLSGGVYLFCTLWTELTIFERLNAAGLLPVSVPPLGSVGLSAVSIAWRLTSGIIITAGLDFSFTMDSYYARSAPGHKERLRGLSRFQSLINADLVFGRTVTSEVSKAGNQVYSSLALRNYRDLFERAFGPAANAAANAASSNIFDLSGNGLPLGIVTLSPETAIEVLSSGKPELAVVADDVPGASAAVTGKLRDFIQGEQNRLTLARDMLSGATPLDHDTLVTLIDECDYLWAHFPDYAAADHGPRRSELEAGSAAAVSFLKRLRVEIDFFLKYWELTLQNI